MPVTFADIGSAGYEDEQATHQRPVRRVQIQDERDSLDENRIVDANKEAAQVASPVDESGYDSQPEGGVAGAASAFVRNSRENSGDDEGAPRPTRARRRKKPDKLAMQTWLCINTHGNTTPVVQDKLKIASKLGVQPRDLRLLDPALSALSPPAILDREKSIAVNLDPIKCIITMDCVYVVNPEEERAAGFIADLKTKLADPNHVGKVMSVYPGISRLSDVTRRLHNAWGATLGLPFELKVLEVCLDQVASGLDQQATEIESIALPALDNLTKRLRSGDLEQIRRMKNRLTRLKTRVETTKEVLEKFLEDDEDMHRLHLTAMEVSRQATLQAGLQADPLLMRSRSVSSRASSRSSSASSASSADSTAEAQVAEVEMLLEAYQRHLDTTFNKLQTLEQYIQDTEDLVNTSLDQHRNRIIATDIVLTATVAALGLGTTLSGIFAQNLTADFQKQEGLFNYIAGLVCVLGPFSLSGLFLLWAYRQGFLSF